MHKARKREYTALPPTTNGMTRPMPTPSPQSVTNDAL
jgi:hypothetical protein